MWIILITIKYMVKKSQIIKRWKKKYLGKWHGYNLLTYPLALVEILEKILTTHWYMCLSSLLSATIIYTEVLLHCKWRKLEPRGKKKRIERERRQTKQLREWESWDAIERDIQIERARELPVSYPVMSKTFATMCWCSESQKDLQSFCCCCANKPLGWKIRIFFLLFCEIFFKITMCSS